MFKDAASVVAKWCFLPISAAANMSLLCISAIVSFFMRSILAAEISSSNLRLSSNSRRSIARIFLLLAICRSSSSSSTSPLPLSFLSESRAIWLIGSEDCPLISISLMSEVSPAMTRVMISATLLLKALACSPGSFIKRQRAPLKLITGWYFSRLPSNWKISTPAARSVVSSLSHILLAPLLSVLHTTIIRPLQARYGIPFMVATLTLFSSSSGKTDSNERDILTFGFLAFESWYI